MRHVLLIVVVLIVAGFACQSALAYPHGFRRAQVYGYPSYYAPYHHRARAYRDSWLYPHPQQYGRWDLYFRMHGSPWRF